VRLAAGTVFGRAPFQEANGGAYGLAEGA